MNRHIFLPLFMLLFVASYELGATTYAPKPVDEILQKTAAIAVVKIVEGRLVTVEHEEESKDCGFKYAATVEDSLLGEDESLEFLAERPLRVGRKYVVFLTEGDTAGQDMISTNSMMWSAIKEQMEIRELCESSFAGLKAIRGLTSEFKSSRFIPSGDEWIDEQISQELEQILAQSGLALVPIN